MQKETDSCRYMFPVSVEMLRVMEWTYCADMKYSQIHRSNSFPFVTSQF